MKKAIPVGHEDLKEIIDKNLYYVDKTLMIKILLEEQGKVNLFTRPRRFGKTLNQSMIRRFFELEYDLDGNIVDNGYIFRNLNIASNGERYMAHQGKYPVINLSLKSAKQPDYEMAYELLIDQIISEYKRHYYLIEKSDMLEIDKQKFINIISKKASGAEYATSLTFLSECLAYYHKKNVIILIDEYDVPLENSYFEGFYDKMTAFIRSLFESALKTNPHLEFAVITGCLRISRESIFTGLNNLKIYSIQNNVFAESFGFTEDEVKEMLSYYGLEDKYDEVREWYDGYRFGSQEIYNPWSIINYIDTARTESEAFPKPYWSNTSSNSIIRDLVEKADREVRAEIERLIEGGTIEKPVHEDITYGDIDESQDSLWNFLYFTGYLKKCGEHKRGEEFFLELSIPNAEIRSIYRNTILLWFNKKIKKTDMSPLIRAIETGDCKTFENFVSNQLMDTISFFDYAENYYHGFLTGLLKSSGKYEVLSNREMGSGRSDIILKEPAFQGNAVILELKVAGTYAQMEHLCEEALSQIDEMQYEASLKAEGCRKIRKYGVCFYKKGCIVKKRD